jgi:hypothetical protein
MGFTVEMVGDEELLDRLEKTRPMRRDAVEPVQLMTATSRGRYVAAWHRWMLALPLLCTILSAPRSGVAEPRLALEYQDKAAFLYNFAKFVDWPSDSLTPSADALILGVVGEDPFGMILEQTFAGKTVHDKKLIVRRFQRIQDVGECHILFISSSENSHLDDILKTLAGGSVLTVGDMDQFAGRGGIIGFRKDDNKVRFEINADAADRAGLKISAQLMKLAVNVISRRTTQP